MVADAVYIVKVEDLTDAVTWVPDLSAGGTYQVYAKWTADETRATDARYSIVHEGGTAEVSVNQRAAGGLWQYLGSYAFDPLHTPTVTLAANDNGSVAADAIRFVGGPGGAADIAYLHADHLGTPQAMTDANAQILWWRDQTPFGQTVAEGGFSSSPLRFPGQYADAESGLAYNYFRDYDPALGRYIQSDPIGLTGGLNTYGYVMGNPLKGTDPSGLFCRSSGGETTCSYPGGPEFKFPTPEGFSDFEGDQLLYHKYDVQEGLGDADPNCVFQEIVKNPTPGTPKPATEEGTPNNAEVLGSDNPVTSYLTKDVNSGAEVVVNVTGPDSAFRSGYVARVVNNGVAHTYGEGTNWKQSPLLTGKLIQDLANDQVWGSQMREIIQRCTCVD